MKKLILLTLAVTACLSLWAQDYGSIRGTVISRADKAYLAEVKVVLNTPHQQTTYSTTPKGEFVFTNVPAGVWEMVFETYDYTSARVTIKVDPGAERTITVSLTPETRSTGVEDSAYAEFDTEGADDSYQDMPVSLSATKDVFDNIASYKFGALRFRPRGYESTSQEVYFNGILFNDAQTGYSPWSLWGGLNDVTRNQEASSGLSIGGNGIGSVNGTTSINATASQVRQGFRAGLAHANGQYLLRAMVTYASGERPSGWSYAFSASTRQGSNLWINGVYYDAWSYYGSIEKKICHDHRLALTVFGAPTERGTQGATTQEVYDLVGSNYYNPNWGYQGGNWDQTTRYLGGGVMRNARVRDNHEPVAILNYTYDISSRTKLLAAASYRFGRNGYSALDWYNAPDPRPDYYRKLPSYEQKQDENWDVYGHKYYFYPEGWANDWGIRQINWNYLYNINYESGSNPNTPTDPAQNSFSRRSVYVLQDRRADQQDVHFKAQVNTLLGERFKLNGGLEYRWNRTEYFQTIKDLLGGDYWLDVDQFAQRAYPQSPDQGQSNLFAPNRVVRKGDKYGYDYYGYVQSGKAWASLRFNRGHWEAYAALDGGMTRLWRYGLYKKGLFPTDSYGSSEKKDFPTYGAKLGLTYKINGNHVVWANAAYIVDAPYFTRSMVSPRTRNDFLPGLKTEKRLSGDVNYSMNLRGVRLRLTGYYTRIQDQSEVISYYDDIQRTFTNFAMSGIDQLHTGVELGLQVPIIWDITLQGALSYGYYIYTSNPKVTQTIDNNALVVLDRATVYYKDYKVDGTPQTAASLGLNYRSPKNLFLGFDAGYYNANYISMNPLRRTDYAYQNLTDPAEIKAMGQQEMFPEVFLFNANIGKMWYKGKYNFGANLSVNNLLNRKNYRTGGYEQMRLENTAATNAPVHYVPFDSKYFYLFGTTYYLTLYFRF